MFLARINGLFTQQKQRIAARTGMHHVVVDGGCVKTTG
jgi:hypothetical protein